MALWMCAGAISGYTVFKTLPKLPYLRNNYYIRKYKYTPFFIFFFTLTYHGYKLMSFQKRKGIRELAKDTTNFHANKKIKEHP